MGIGIAALWARGLMTEILAIVFMTLLVLSFLIPVSRQKLKS
jgi:hypothetical protein